MAIGEKEWKRNQEKRGPKVFVLDVDGGSWPMGSSFIQKKEKQFKIFGPDDNDGLSLL